MIRIIYAFIVVFRFIFPLLPSSFFTILRSSRTSFVSQPARSPHLPSDTVIVFISRIRFIPVQYLWCFQHQFTHPMHSIYLLCVFWEFRFVSNSQDFISLFQTLENSVDTRETSCFFSLQWLLIIILAFNRCCIKSLEYLLPFHTQYSHSFRYSFAFKSHK